MPATSTFKILDIADFNTLKSSFGTVPPDPSYDSRADFNRDNLVDASDFNLLKLNFGITGEPQSCP